VEERGGGLGRRKGPVLAKRKLFPIMTHGGGKRGQKKKFKYLNNREECFTDLKSRARIGRERKKRRWIFVREKKRCKECIETEEEGKVV